MLNYPHSTEATIAGAAMTGLGFLALSYGGQWALYLLTAAVCGPIIGHCIYVRIKHGYWPNY